MWKILKALLKAFDIFCSIVFIITILAAAVGLVVWLIKNYILLIFALIILLLAGLLLKATEKGKEYVKEKEEEYKRKSGN